MNSLVPSSGSTRKKVSPCFGIRPAATSSSAMTGTPAAARANADAAVETHGGRVDVGILDHETGEAGIFLSLAEPFREGHLGRQRVLDVRRHHRHHRRLEHAR